MGNYKERQEYDRETTSLGLALRTLDRIGRTQQKPDSPVFQGCSLKATVPGVPGDWFLVARFDVQGEPMVSFVGGISPSSCIQKLRSNVENGRLKLVHDKYADRSAGGP